MPGLVHLRTAAAAACLAACGAAIAAPSIAGDPFDFTVVVDDGIGGTETHGPFSGTAAAVADDYFFQADGTAAFLAGATDYDVRINWNDANSFDLFLNGFGAIDLNNASVTLSGLDFKDGVLPASIVGASFNRAASNVDDYAAGPGFGSPGVSFTANSVTITYPYFEAALVADGPRLRFDVQALAVPEPATWSMLLLGVAGVAGWARRRRSA